MQPIVSSVAEAFVEREFMSGRLINNVANSVDIITAAWSNSYSFMSRDDDVFWALLLNEEGKPTVMPAYFAFDDMWKKLGLTNPLEVDWVNSGQITSDKHSPKDYAYYIWFVLRMSIRLYDQWYDDEDTRNCIPCKLFPVFLTAMAKLSRHLNENVEDTILAAAA